MPIRCGVAGRGVEEEPVLKAWKEFWPRTGNPPNWDAIGKIRSSGSQTEWLLVEAKAHLERVEERRSCKARRWPLANRSGLQRNQGSIWYSGYHKWLEPYYQFCNRLAVLHFLMQQQKESRLLFIYFLGDEHPGKVCPKSEDEWLERLKPMYAHVGLTGKSVLEERVHRIFLPVCDTVLPSTMCNNIYYQSKNVYEAQSITFPLALVTA